MACTIYKALSWLHLNNRKATNDNQHAQWAICHAVQLRQASCMYCIHIYSIYIYSSYTYRIHLSYLHYLFLIFLSFAVGSRRKTSSCCRCSWANALPLCPRDCSKSPRYVWSYLPLIPPHTSPGRCPCAVGAPGSCQHGNESQILWLPLIYAIAGASRGQWQISVLGKQHSWRGDNSSVAHGDR